MNRDEVFEYAREYFGTLPEYLWESSPDSAVLRRGDNNKWYGIVMSVPRKRLGLTGEGNADVLNVKCDPLVLGSCLMQKGFLPAYHMNKDKWISIVLDGGVPDGDIKRMLQESYDMVKASKKNKRLSP